jgi:DNA repair protein RadC
MVVYINVKNNVIDNALFQAGKLDNVAVSQRRIIGVALSKNASAIILVYNHPS